MPEPKTTREKELERLIQEIHSSYNPGAGRFDIEAALKTMRESTMKNTESKTTNEEDLSIIVTVKQGGFNLSVKLNEASMRGEILNCVDDLLNVLYGYEGKGKLK
jgi:hypothetical protein